MKRMIPFDIELAKQGAKVVTRGGFYVRLIDYHIQNDERPILGLILEDGKERPQNFTKTGNLYNDGMESRFDLFIEEEVDEQKRRMTVQQLSWWLRDCPNEHREYMYKSKADEPNVHIIYPYCVIEADEEVDADIYIRRNGGEWKEPLVEELESSDDKDTYQGVTVGTDTKLYTIG